MRVRAATPDDRAAVANVLDGAMLDTDSDLLADSIERGETLVAVAGGDGSGPDGGDGDDRILGAIVLAGDRIVSVAVRRRRRGQGIGRALVEVALADRDRLVAEFDERVRPFYESLGFEIEQLEEGGSRYRGYETGD